MTLKEKLESDPWFAGAVFDTVREDDSGNLITGENYLVLYWDTAQDSADRLTSNHVHSRQYVAVQAVCVDPDGVRAWLDRVKSLLTGFAPEVDGRHCTGLQPTGRDPIESDSTSGMFFSEQRFRFDTDPA